MAKLIAAMNMTLNGSSDHRAQPWSAAKKPAPLVLSVALLAMGIPKAVISWAPLAPIWYHAIYTAILIPMTVN